MLSGTDQLHTRHSKSVASCSTCRKCYTSSRAILVPHQHAAVHNAGAFICLTVIASNLPVTGRPVKLWNFLMEVVVSWFPARVGGKYWYLLKKSYQRNNVVVNANLIFYRGRNKRCNLTCNITRNIARIYMLDRVHTHTQYLDRLTTCYSHRKVLLSSGRLNGHTSGFHPQTQKLERSWVALSDMINRTTGK